MKFSAHELEWLRERTLRWIETQGFILDDSNFEAKRKIGVVWEVVRCIFDGLYQDTVVAISTYRQAEQTDKYSGDDAMAWKNVTDDYGPVWAILVSVEAVEQGPAYIALLLLHELAHLFMDGEGGHGTEFEDVLDLLIERYNACTGAQIVNDYTRDIKLQE